MAFCGNKIIKHNIIQWHIFLGQSLTIILEFRMSLYYEYVFNFHFKVVPYIWNIIFSYLCSISVQELDITALGLKSSDNIDLTLYQQIILAKIVNNISAREDLDFALLNRTRYLH